MKRSAAEFKRFRAETVRLGAEVSPQAANAGEAGEAGEAGKGFAVVAQEVKLLAGQTGGATNDIGAKIEAIRSATEEFAGAIAAIEGTIQELRDMDLTVAAAVEQQAGAAREITRAIVQVSTSTGKVADSMTAVRAAAHRGSATLAEVKQTALELSGEADLMGEEVKSFLAAMKTFAGSQELLIHDVDLAAEALLATGPVSGRVRQISLGFALFSGPLVAEPGTPIDLRLQGFDEPLQTRLIGPADGGGFHVQFPLTHEHMAYMTRRLAGRPAPGVRSPAAA